MAFSSTASLLSLFCAGGLSFTGRSAFVAVNLLLATSVFGGQVRCASAPDGEPLSTQFKVEAGGASVPVYTARVQPADRKEFLKALGEQRDPALVSAVTSFASFDLQGATPVVVTCPDEVRTAKVLPSSAKVVPRIHGNRVEFDVTRPGSLTLETNGNEIEALHLFVNPWEGTPPKPDAPNVIYFGPGIHEVDGVEVTSGQTVYIADGAVVRGKIDPEKKSHATFLLSGSNITFRGRGIVDGGLCPRHTRNLLYVTGTNVTIEGVIFRDSSTWNIPVRRSKNITLKNLKVFGYRGNSDGIDICNSQYVTVSNCFLRTWDDLVVVKTDKGQGAAARILVENCVLWNELAHALSIGAELREPVEDVRFQDCDVIHDKGREWTLRVYHCDSAPIRNILFSNIRVEESPRLISLWIGKAIWSRDAERGHISGVTFEDIQVKSGQAKISLQGFDDTHRVENVQFNRVTLGGAPLKPEQVAQNGFVGDVSVKP